jgi:hypothetical protein
MTYKEFEYDVQEGLTWREAELFLRRFDITPDHGVRSKRFFIAAKQILVGRRRRLRCSIMDKKRLDDVIIHIKKCDGNPTLSTNKAVKIDMSDFVIKEEFTETRYHEKEVQEEVEEVIVTQEAPMVERRERTYESKRTRNVGYSKKQVSTHNTIVDRAVIYRRIEELEKLPPSVETKKEIDALFLSDCKKYGDKPFHSEWLTDPKYLTKVEQGGTETFFQTRTEVTVLDPVPVETIKVRKKTITNIVREPYECKTIRYKKIQEADVWRTVGQKKQMEIVHGIFLFEGEPGFAPLRSYIRYKDYNRENKIAKEKNKETRDKYLKIRSWEYFNQRKKRGKNQRKKNYDKYMKAIEGKTPLLKEDYDKLMKELIIPIRPIEEVPLEKRYERVVEAVDSFLCLRDHRRGCGKLTSQVRLPCKVVRCLGQIWRHLKHGTPMKEIKDNDRNYWQGFYKSRRKLKRFMRPRGLSNDSLNEITNSEYISYVPESNVDYDWDNQDYDNFMY